MNGPEPLTALLPAELLRRLEAEAARRGEELGDLLADLLSEELPSALADAAAALLSQQNEAPRACDSGSPKTASQPARGLITSRDQSTVRAALGPSKEPDHGASVS